MIRDNTVQIIGDLEKKLQRPNLIIKAGFDPTAPDLHLGHAVILTKLREFQDLGHIVTIIVGGFTAQIGDPSGKNKLRPSLSKADVQENSETYEKQVFKILDKNKTIIKNNNDWLSNIKSDELIKLMSNVSISQMLDRKDFYDRFMSEQTISLHEFIYPLLQAYDSVVLNADLEIGGTDQLFNLLLGRELQEKLGLEPQVVITMPLLVGLDGQQKMSKSIGNHIGLFDSPEDIFTKVKSMNSTHKIALANLLNLSEKTEKSIEWRVVSLLNGSGTADMVEKNFYYRYR